MPDQPGFDRRTAPTMASRGDPAFTGGAAEAVTQYDGSPAGGDNPARAPSPVLAMQVEAGPLAIISPPAPGTLYCRVTPAAPRADSKAALVFVRPDLVEGGRGYARFSSRLDDKLGIMPTPDGYAVLWVWSPAGRKYLIDCAVGGMYYNLSQQYGAEYVVAGPGATQSFDFRNNYSADGYHLVFVFTATAAGWYSFALSTAPAGGTTLITEWDLYACDLTHQA